MAVARIGFENKYGRVKSSVLSPIKNKVIYVEKKNKIFIDHIDQCFITEAQAHDIIFVLQWSWLTDFMFSDSEMGYAQ